MPPRLLLTVLVAGFVVLPGAPLLGGVPQATESAAPGDTGGLRLVIWYDRSRPFETFRHRAYDLRNGEYTKAVDDWMELMSRDYPGYTVSVRDLAVAKGDSAEKVAAVVEDARLALAKSIILKHGIGVPDRNLEYRSGYRGPSWSPEATAPTRKPSLFKNGIPSSFSPLGAAHPVRSPTYLFPNPMPYPRPHP